MAQVLSVSLTPVVVHLRVVERAISDFLFVVGDRGAVGDERGRRTKPFEAIPYARGNRDEFGIFWVEIDVLIEALGVRGRAIVEEHETDRSNDEIIVEGHHSMVVPSFHDARIDLAEIDFAEFLESRFVRTEHMKNCSSIVKELSFRGDDDALDRATWFELLHTGYGVRAACRSRGLARLQSLGEPCGRRRCLTGVDTFGVHMVAKVDEDCRLMWRIRHTTD